MSRVAPVSFRWLSMLLVGVVVPQAEAQKPKPRVNPYGSHAFRNILHHSNLKPLKNPRDLADRPKTTWVIVLGATDFLDDRSEPGDLDLQEYLRQGGAVLVASDRGDGLQIGAVFQTFKVALESGVVIGSNEKDSNAVYAQNAHCPYVFPVRTDPAHRLFRNVTRLATNTPSLAVARGTDLHALAKFKPDQTIWLSRGEAKRLPGDQAFAFGNDNPTGTRLLLAGHGVFMNGMMADQSHRDNIYFARNVIDWFTKDESGRVKRTHVLFYEEGKILEKFDVPLKEMPLPPIPTVEKINQLIRRLEEENFHNRMLFKILGPGGVDEVEQAEIVRRGIIRWSFVVLSGLLVLYGLRRFWKARYRRDVTIPLVLAGVARTVPNVSLMSQRHEDMIHEGSFWEASRELARLCFAEYVNQSATVPAGEPRALVVGRRWRPETLRHLVRRLWHLAYVKPAFPVDRTVYREYLNDVEDVRAALKGGELKLIAPSMVPDGRPRATI